MLSIPWYRDGGDETGTLLGLPGWVGVAILCYLAVAILNAGAWLLTDIPEETDEPDAGEAP